MDGRGFAQQTALPKIIQPTICDDCDLDTRITTVMNYDKYVIVPKQTYEFVCSICAALTPLQ